MVSVTTPVQAEPQWFIVRGWLDSKEWGDEPPDPDDCWAVGDRVRLRNSTVEGTVSGEQQEAFLGSLYLPYVLVLWDGKNIPVPVEPELLLRLTRFIPEDLTWRAHESFSDEPNSKRPNGKTKISQVMDVGDVVSGEFGKGTILHIHGKKATVIYNSGAQKTQIKLCHLQLVEKGASSSGGKTSSRADTNKPSTGHKRDKNSSGGNSENSSGGKSKCSNSSISVLVLEQDSSQRKGDNCHTIKDNGHHKIELCQRTEDQKLQKNTGNCINKDLAVKMSVKPSELEETLCGKSSKTTATTLEQKNCSHSLNLRENDTPQTMTGITDVQNAIATSSYIELSGNNKMGLFHTVITSTIKTETNQTIESKTLNVLPLQNKEKFTDSQKDTSLSRDSYHTTQEPLEDSTREKFILHQDAQQQQLEEVNEQSGKQSLTKPNQQELTGSTQTRCLQQSTYVRELGQVSLMPHSVLENLSLKDSVNLMNGVNQSSNADFQVSQSTQMLRHSQSEKSENNSDRSTVFLPLPPVLPSPLKASDLGQRTNETVSPQFCESSTIINPDLQSLRTFPVCSPVPTPLVMNEVTSGMFWKSFKGAGMMRNGLLWDLDTLPLPLLESESCWLLSPGALSSIGKGRPPGLTKQESQLRESNTLAPGEVINPEFLESAYNLPLGWTDPQDNRSVWEFLKGTEQQERDVQPLETPSIGELQPLHSNGSSTFTSCPSCEVPLLKLEDGCGVCGWFPPEPKRRTASGWLEKYVKNKTLKKTGVKATFPKVEGHRDPDNDSHWYWAYKYEEKSPNARSSNGHVTKAVSVPVHKLGIVRRALADNKPVSLILQFIKN